ncbi:unnamed protein product, partial [Discosporangium mesarthrocarpum]
KEGITASANFQRARFSGDFGPGGARGRSPGPGSSHRARGVEGGSGGAEPGVRVRNTVALGAGGLGLHQRDWPALGNRLDGLEPGGMHPGVGSRGEHGLHAGPGPQVTPPPKSCLEPHLLHAFYAWSCREFSEPVD